MPSTSAAFEDLALLGLCLIPTLPGTKRPAGPWAKGQWTLQRVLGYLAAHPRAGIAIVCGAASGGLFVIDVDCHGSIDGRKSMADFERKHGRLPGTVTVITPSVGVHLWFLMPKGMPVPRSSVNAAIGVDIRGEGGLATCPPTALPAGTYRYADGLSPDDVEIAVADERVMLLLREVQARHQASSGARTITGLPVRRGARNDTTYRYSCHVRAMGGNELDVATMAAAFNQLWCRPPMDERELLGIVESACRNPRGESTWLEAAGLPDVSEPAVGGEE